LFVVKIAFLLYIDVFLFDQNTFTNYVISKYHLAVFSEQEIQEPDGDAQDVAGSYELLQQQLRETNETIATLMEQSNQMQQEASPFHTVL